MTTEENKKPSAAPAETLTDIVGYFAFDPEELLLPDGNTVGGAITSYTPMVDGVEFRTVLQELHSGSSILLDPQVAADVKRRIERLDPTDYWGFSESKHSHGAVEIALCYPDETIEAMLWEDELPTEGKIKKALADIIAEFP